MSIICSIQDWVDVIGSYYKLPTSGYAFTLPLFSLLGGCRIGCYVQASGPVDLVIFGDIGHIPRMPGALPHHLHGHVGAGTICSYSIANRKGSSRQHGTNMHKPRVDHKILTNFCGSSE